jgi:hypothetical protein
VPSQVESDHGFTRIIAPIIHDRERAHDFSDVGKGQITVVIEISTGP